MALLLLLAAVVTSAGCNALSPVSPLARLELRMVFQPETYPDGN